MKQNSTRTQLFQDVKQRSFSFMANQMTQIPARPFFVMKNSRSYWPYKSQLVPLFNRNSFDKNLRNNQIANIVNQAWVRLIEIDNKLTLERCNRRRKRSTRYPTTSKVHATNLYLQIFWITGLTRKTKRISVCIEDLLEFAPNQAFSFVKAIWFNYNL